MQITKVTLFRYRLQMMNKYVKWLSTLVKIHSAIITKLLQFKQINSFIPIKMAKCLVWTFKLLKAIKKQKNLPMLAVRIEKN